MSAPPDRIRAVFEQTIGSTLSGDEQVLLDQMCLAYKRSIAHKSPRQMDAESKVSLSRAASRLTDKIKLNMRDRSSEEEGNP
jgi:hypothetical protein